LADRLIGRFLSKSTERRIGSADEAAELLRGCLAHLRAPSRMALPTEIAGRLGWRKIVGACILASTFILAGYGAAKQFSNPPVSQSVPTSPPNRSSQPATIEFEDQAWRVQMQKLTNEIHELKGELNEALN
jgi:hypothetical protein